MTGVRVERRRGAFGLDDRRRRDPRRVEADLLALLAMRHPDVWPLAEAEAAATDATGRTLTLLLPEGRVALIRVERDPADPGPAARALAARCRMLRIPHAVVASVEDGRAVLRRLGVAPSPGRPSSQGAA